jgi:hypothetical protein
MIRWGAFGVAIGTAAVLLAGCDTAVAGRAVPDRGPLHATASTPITARTAFGDAVTVRPCGVVDVARLPEGWHGRLLPAESLDSCQVSVRDAGTTVDVTVGPLQPLTTYGPANYVLVATLERGMTIYAPRPEVPGFCDEYLRFTDDVELGVTATPSELDSQVDVCPAAEALARNAAEQISAGRIAHRDFPAGSVGRLDPCDLVPAGGLSGFGLPGVVPTRYPQRHECTWRGPGGESSTTLRVDFTVGTPPKAAGPRDTSTRVAGHTTVTSPVELSGTSALCVVETGLHPARDGTAGRVEIALVDVRVPSGGTAKACGAATSVATAVWPTLPLTP